MTPSDAATFAEARRLLDELAAVKAQLTAAIRNNVDRETKRNIQARQHVIAREIEQLPKWAVSRASGDDLKHALTLSVAFDGSDGAARLRRWAVSRYQGERA